MLKESKGFVTCLRTLLFLDTFFTCSRSGISAGVQLTKVNFSQNYARVVETCWEGLPDFFSSPVLVAKVRTVFNGTVDDTAKH